MTRPYVEALEGQHDRLRPLRVETFTANTVEEARRMAIDAVDAAGGVWTRIMTMPDGDRFSATVTWRITDAS